MKRFVPCVDGLEARAMLDGEQAVSGIGPLPEVAGNPIGGILENPGDATSMIPRDQPAFIDLDLLGLGPNLTDPLISAYVPFVAVAPGLPDYDVASGMPLAENAFANPDPSQ